MSNHQETIVMINDAAAAASASAEIIKCSTNERVRARVRVDRPAYTNSQFEDEFRVIEQEDTHDGLATDQRNSLPKRSTCCRRFESLVSVFNPIRIFRLFTIFEVLANYKCRLYLASDIMSGITVGIMNIPAALAYGALTSLNPVHGLYTSFYGGLTYALFGTSRHLSVGTFAVTSLMVYSTINRVESEIAPMLSQQSVNDSFVHRLGGHLYHKSDANYLYYWRMAISTSLAFWCGIFQIIFSLLRFGTIYKYLPRPLLRSFTTAAGFHVFSSQVKHVFGIYYKEKESHKFFKLFYVYERIFEHIDKINWATFILSSVSILIILLFKSQVNTRLPRALKTIPFPIELLVIIVTTLICSFGSLKNMYEIPVIGHIPKGLASPSLPDFSLFTHVARDAFVIAVVAFAASISVSDLYARKHKYKIDSNREFFALGMANVAGSFFKSFVSCASLARTVVVESSGGKTQLVSIISSFILMSVMLWLTSLLENLPKACLASIILTAILSILKQLKDVVYYWKLDKLDCLIWCVTFVSSIVLDIDYGLGIGILTVLFLNTYRSQNVELKVVGQIKDYELFFDVKKYQAEESETIKIIRPSHPIFYVNCDQFRDKLEALCPLKDTGKRSHWFNKCRSTNNEVIVEDEDSQIILDHDQTQMVESATPEKLEAIILDCANIVFMDEAGLNSLRAAIEEYEAVGVRLVLTNCHESVLELFKKMKFECKFVYLTISDAIESIRNKCA